MRLSSLLILSLLAAAPTAAAPVKKAAAKPAAPTAAKKTAPTLRSITVLPNEFRLVGARSEQGLVVTGAYADGSVRDLSGAAQFRVDNPKIAAVRVEDDRRVVRPVGDGAATVTVTVPGAAPVSVPVEVKDAGQAQPVSFKDEVVPAFTKLGCSAGTCHGTPTGKGGFRLSLQGYAPELDYQALVREGGSRRVNVGDPGRSLLLLKPLVEMPHAGGKRLSAEMPEFDILTRWISEGAKNDAPDAPELVKVEVLPGRRTLELPDVKQHVVAMGHFSDGSIRDVTRVAKLSTSDEETGTVTREGLVEAEQRGDLAVLVRYQYALQAMPLTFVQDVPGFKWNDPAAFNYVDTHIFDRLKLFQIPTSDLAPDTEFIRRAYLDTTGLVPTADEVRAFLKDPAPDKRKKLIDQLTQRPEFADYWALKWADVMRIQDETMKGSGAKAFHTWVRDSLAANKPMDRFVSEILTASGPTTANPPANYFRAVKEPDGVAEATAQLFLGVRMACAKCHNHPFERWTQDEYYQLAAFFAQVRHKGGPGKDEETITLNPKGQVTHLRTGKVMTPKLLGAGFVEMAPEQDRRTALADWMTRRDNPFFAKATVNRVWANLLGRGIVEPIDDFRDSNPPVNEALLEALAKDFAEHGFDFRYLVRTIMNSRTYQLTALTVPLNKDDSKYFSHAFTQRLTAEQLADAVARVTGVPDKYEGYPEGTRAAQLAGTSVRTDFLKTFGRPDRNLNCECEREKDPTLFQALRLITDRNLNSKLKSEKGRLATLAASSMTHEQVLEELYLSALARFPSEKEKRELSAFLTQSGDRRKALEDVAWALINSKEFQFRH